MFAKVSIWREQRYGSENLDTLSSVMSLADLRQNLGRLEEAVALVKWVHERLVKTLGRENPETLKCSNNWACMLEELGKLKEAQELYQEVYDALQERLGPDDPETL